MKKFLIFIASLLVASSVWADAWDYDFKIDGLYYRIYGTENKVEVFGCDDNHNISGNVFIPSSVTYDGKTYVVTRIPGYGDGHDPRGSYTRGFGFDNLSEITSVTIPNTVTFIANGAFYGCEKLTAVVISNSVTSIGDYVFGDCPNLTSITIPEGVTSIGDYAFYRCSSLTSITIPSSVTSIGESAFNSCSSLTFVNIPNSVTSIGVRAFGACTNLTSITIPEGVTSIGGRAFGGCSSLTSVTVPTSVTSIGENAFADGVGTVIYVGNAEGAPWGANEWQDYLAKDMNYEYLDSKYTIIKKYIGQATDVVIPPIITTICNGAFSGSSITSVTIPSSVTKVEDGAFSGCTALKNVTCLATVPPTAYANSFENYNGYLSIPCESKDDYDFASCWGSFKHVDCIGSESVELTKDEVAVVPEKTEAVFSMPKNENANTYTLTISNNGVTFCSLTFNAQGQLANIDFSTTKSYELKSDVAGFQFTVTGLSTASDYGYSFKALASNKSVLKEYAGSFTTKNENGTGGSAQGGGEVEGGGQGGSTAVSEVSNATAVTIANGQILVNGEAPAFVVTVSGQKIANANLKAGVYFVVVDGNSVSVVVR